MNKYIIICDLIDTNVNNCNKCHEEIKKYDIYSHHSKYMDYHLYSATILWERMTDLLGKYF